MGDEVRRRSSKHDLSSGVAAFWAEIADIVEAWS
jgi:hypothetical protein